MTYMTRRHRTRARRKPSGMGGLFDLLTTSTIDLFTNSDCPEEADESVAGLDNTISDIERSWSPTGFYTPDEINKVVTTVLDQVAPVTSELERLMAEMTFSDRVKGMFVDAQRKVGESVAFVNAGRDARSKGIRVVNAPGLKPWVIDALKANRNMARQMMLESCNRGAIQILVTRQAQAGMVVRSVVLAVGGAALRAGEAVVTVVGGIGSFLGTVVPLLPYLAIGGGALYLFKKMKERRG